jgi:hypothetical protein
MVKYRQNPRFAGAVDLPRLGILKEPKNRPRSFDMEKAYKCDMSSHIKTKGAVFEYLEADL